LVKYAKITDNPNEAAMKSNAIDEILRGVVDCFVREELQDRLASGKPLRVKAGFDPTAPDLHLGHTVLFNKMRQFQDLGHEVMFVIGDFTGMIGDPTGKNQTRPVLTEEQVIANAQTYQDQVFKILDPNKTQVLRNSAWLSKLSSAQMIKLSGHSTVARMLEREDFAKRYANGHGISIHEFLYPLLQGYDSVELQADIELGGTDQTFNLLMGRDMQKQAGQLPQVVLTLPLLEGLDGVKKMSKSVGNVVSVMDSPDEMFGKLMSISDDLMWRYYDLLSFLSSEQIAAAQARVRAGGNPRDEKVALAKELVARFHDEPSAEQAAIAFNNRFAKGVLPTDVPEKQLHASEQGVLIGVALKQAGLVASTSEAMRMIKQGAVKCDGVAISDRQYCLLPGTTTVCQVGKRRVAKLSISLS
jgi:tyrosyl-tRNA synthetase